MRNFFVFLGMVVFCTVGFGHDLDGCQCETKYHYNSYVGRINVNRPSIEGLSVTPREWALQVATRGHQAPSVPKEQVIVYKVYKQDGSLWSLFSEKMHRSTGPGHPYTFRGKVPTPSWVKRVDLIYLGKVLYSHTRSANKPEILSLDLDGMTPDFLFFKVEFNDADQDQLTYSVEVKTENKPNWKTVAVAKNGEDTTFRIYSGNIQNAKKFWVRVKVNDSFWASVVEKEIVLP